MEQSRQWIGKIDGKHTWSGVCPLDGTVFQFVRVPLLPPQSALKGGIVDRIADFLLLDSVLVFKVMDGVLCFCKFLKFFKDDMKMFLMYFKRSYFSSFRRKIASKSTFDSLE